MIFQSFEDIEAWQEARKLMQRIRKICNSEPAKRDWEWVKQIKKAGLSIMANIAEGNDAQTNPEFAAFLGYSKRSAAEVRSHMYYGLDSEYMTQEEFNTICDSVKRIGSKLCRLIEYLRKHPDGAPSQKNVQRSTFNLQQP